ncbi:hypothetical protein [Amycolatopsis palatopharyngis]|uniref:hypothetical protein n=1 Tax=Amycolatopsis palatopharyngis TaxID=187982 RepID=UPI000E21D5D9|nr:hypothetical protein [Amycolatopsis palatopharyngis]
MSIPGAFGSWLPWRELEGLFTAGRTLLPSMPTSPSGVLQTAIRTVGDRLVGNRLTVRAADTDLRMTLVELDCRISSVGIGQADVGDLRLVVEDVESTEGGHIPVRRAVIVCRDLRVRSIPVPTLATQAIELTITVGGDVVRDLVTQARPDVLADVGADRILRLRSARRPGWGHLQVEPYIDGSRILLRPVAAQVSRVRVPLPTRVRPIPVDVPDLPRGLRLTGIETGPGNLVLRGVTDHWRDRLASIPLSSLLGALTSAATTLTVPWLGEP